MLRWFWLLYGPSNRKQRAVIVWQRYWPDVRFQHCPFVCVPSSVCPTCQTKRNVTRHLSVSCQKMLKDVPFVSLIAKTLFQRQLSAEDHSLFIGLGPFKIHEIGPIHLRWCRCAFRATLITFLFLESTPNCWLKWFFGKCPNDQKTVFFNIQVCKQAWSISFLCLPIIHWVSKFHYLLPG